MKRYGKVLVASASALAVLGVGSVASADGHLPPPGGPSGTHEVEPEVREGNLSCTELQPDGAEWNELKFGGLHDAGLDELEAGEQMTFTRLDDADDNPGDLEVTVTVTMGDWEQQTFDWESNSEVPVSAVIAKGIGNMNVNFYEYDEPVTSDTGLHAPIDVNRSMEPFDLKKIRFCYEDEDDTTTTTVEDTTTTVEETTTTTVEETTTTTVEETTTTTAPPEGAAPPPAPPAQPVVGQPNFVG